MLDFSAYKKKLQDVLTTLTAEKKIFSTSERCCLIFSEQEIYLLHINNKNSRYQILFSEKLKYDTSENLPAILTNIIKTYRLFNIPTSWLLQFADYQLFIIESLPVPKEELLDALSWRIRSLINYPIQDAVIDYFEIPAKKSSPDNPLIAAIVTKSSFIRSNIELFKTTKFSLLQITIPELALKNLTSYYETDDKSTAFIYFYGNSAILNITKNKTLYFTRRLTLPIPIDPTSNPYEQFAFELVRYFDYFQSQWRTPTPSRVLIHAPKEKTFDIIKSLTEFLTAQLEPFDIKKLPVDSKEIIEGNFLLALGCLLEENEKHAEN